MEELFKSLVAFATNTGMNYLFFWIPLALIAFGGFRVADWMRKRRHRPPPPDSTDD